MKTDLQILLRLEKIYKRANSPFWWWYMLNDDAISWARRGSLYTTILFYITPSKEIIVRLFNLIDRTYDDDFLFECGTHMITLRLTYIRKAIKEERRKNDKSR